ncbi:phospholipase D-like domain-containing protein [Acidithiobacillus thiooxidans]|uniref:phospholipase D-like domain-containing protein n=1 Tax=Acidithiobacillus thiooxidans TaxID=930 RepID=UPI00285B5F8E|nr:phospholipase D-like domain-containing protein [Acidithiobacillus thiooxidans]MDR7925615.1 phospholipase D-like domain-containing protein [Acidithiobacillus thiooxidans]
MLYIEPQAGVSPILQVIQSARHTLNVGVYYLTDRPILRAIQAAKTRGVDVRVIIEGKPYGMKSWQVRKEEKAIEATGAQLHLAPYRFTSHGSQWSFYHAKYLASGHEAEIGNPNFAWSDFHDARNYLYVTQNPTIVKAVNAVFNADWNNRRAPAWTHQVLVLSPGTSVKQIAQVIDQPGPIAIEDEEIGPYAPTLDAIAAKGKLARVIMPANINAQDKKDAAFLEAHGVQVRLLPVKPIYVHSKLVVGNTLAYIGSENLTRTSLERNREIGLLLNGRDITELQTQINKDWRAAQ